MKIAVLLGSPRKKDSYKACQAFLQHIQNAEVTYIHLKDYRIDACKGCDQCFQKSEACCPCKDDLGLVKEKLLAADGIIFAAPVYAYQVPGPMKVAIDRLSYWFHRQALVGKPAITVVTSGGGGHQEVAKYLKMTASGWGCQFVGGISLVAPYYFNEGQKDSVLAFNPKYFEKQNQVIQSLAGQFEAAVNNPFAYVPSYYDLFLFNGLRTKTVTSAADYAFWKQKGWIESDYFFGVKLSPLKKLFSRCLKALIDWQVKKATAGSKPMHAVDGNCE